MNTTEIKVYAPSEELHNYMMQIVNQIQLNINGVSKSIIEIGRYLFNAKLYCTSPNHEYIGWMQYISEYVNFTHSYCEDLIHLYQRWKDLSPSSQDMMLQLGTTKMIEIARLPQNINIDALFQVEYHFLKGDVKISEATVNQVRQIVKTIEVLDPDSFSEVMETKRLEIAEEEVAKTKAYRQLKAQLNGFDEKLIEKENKIKNLTQKYSEISTENQALKEQIEVLTDDEKKGKLVAKLEKKIVEQEKLQERINEREKARKILYESLESRFDQAINSYKQQHYFAIGQIQSVIIDVASIQGFNHGKVDNAIQEIKGMIEGLQMLVQSVEKLKEQTGN